MHVISNIWLVIAISILRQPLPFPLPFPSPIAAPPATNITPTIISPQLAYPPVFPLHRPLCARQKTPKKTGTAAAGPEKSKNHTEESQQALLQLGTRQNLHYNSVRKKHHFFLLFFFSWGTAQGLMETPLDLRILTLFTMTVTQKEYLNKTTF